MAALELCQMLMTEGRAQKNLLPPKLVVILLKWGVIREAPEAPGFIEITERGRRNMQKAEFASDRLLFLKEEDFAVLKRIIQKGYVRLTNVPAESASRLRRAKVVVPLVRRSADSDGEELLTATAAAVMAVPGVHFLDDEWEDGTETK